MTNLSESLHITLLRFILLAATAFFSTGAGCADFDPAPSPSCVLDTECSEAQEICFRGACTAACVTDDECGGGICRSEARAEHGDVVDVCVGADDVNALVMECRFDADCAEAFPDVDARCGIDGACFIPVFALLIRDTTAGRGALDGGIGADIAAIYLEDPLTGDPIAWAETLSVRSTVSDGSNAPNGSATPLNADLSCVDAPYEDATTPLGGPGGTLLVRFLDIDTRETISSSPSTWNVVIIEWGENCSNGELVDSDSFNVFACAGTSHRTIDADRNCGEFLGSAATGGRVTISAE